MTTRKENFTSLMNATNAMIKYSTDYTAIDFKFFMEDMKEELKAYKDEILALTEKLMKLEDNIIEQEEYTNYNFYINEYVSCAKALQECKEERQALYKKQIEVFKAYTKIYF